MTMAAPIGSTVTPNSTTSLCLSIMSIVNYGYLIVCFQEKHSGNFELNTFLYYVKLQRSTYVRTFEAQLTKIVE